MTPQPPRELRPKTEQPAMPEAPTLERKAAFRKNELAAGETALRRMADAVGVRSIHWSAMDRVLWMLLVRAVEAGGSLDRGPLLQRPNNGNPVAMLQFEEQLAEYLLTLFKNTPRD